VLEIVSGSFGQIDSGGRYKISIKSYLSWRGLEPCRLMVNAAKPVLKSTLPLLSVGSVLPRQKFG